MRGVEVYANNFFNKGCPDFFIKYTHLPHHTFSVLLSLIHLTPPYPPSPPEYRECILRGVPILPDPNFVGVGWGALISLTKILIYPCPAYILCLSFIPLLSSSLPSLTLPLPCIHFSCVLSSLPLPFHCNFRNISKSYVDRSVQLQKAMCIVFTFLNIDMSQCHLPGSDC